MHEFNYLHPNWHPWYQGRDVHTLQSVTKSVTATLFGIALAAARSGVDEPFLPFFRTAISPVDARLRTATLADLLTMRSGIEWHENDRPLDETNTTAAARAEPGLDRFTLASADGRRPGHEVGVQQRRQRADGGDHPHRDRPAIATYASERLFTPLGIRDFHWKKTPTGHPDTEGGLYLSPRTSRRSASSTWTTACGTASGPARGVGQEATSRARDDVADEWATAISGGATTAAGRRLGGQRVRRPVPGRGSGADLWRS